MRFQIVYPGVAAIDCRDCHKYVYDLEYGIKEIDEEINMPIERDVPPPCSSCPKGEVDFDFERLGLDPRNEKLYTLYRAIKIAGGVMVPDHLRNCEIFRSNIVLVEDVVESATMAHKARITRMAKEG